MFTRRTYSTLQMAYWTRLDTLRFAVIIAAWVAAYSFFDIGWLRVPWTPLALIGTAVAFVIGFQNNAAYGRIWEARKIWGGIVNTSRTFGMWVQDMVTNEHANEAATDEALQAEIKTLTYRHIAWMTALRHAMRAEKPWETAMKERSNRSWAIKPPERESTLEADLRPYLSEEDLADIMSKGNKQIALLYQQSHHIKRLKDEGHVWEFAFLQLEGALEELFTLQGRSERIKNFPYPRQYATLNHFFMWLLLLVLPIALVPQFADMAASIASEYPIFSEVFVWLAVPMYSCIAWVFHTMERIGRTGDNPFEGTANDVPISTIARGIEIDLRQNLGENKEDIPEQFPMQYNVQF